MAARGIALRGSRWPSGLAGRAARLGREFVHVRAPGSGSGPVRLASANGLAAHLAAGK